MCDHEKFMNFVGGLNENTAKRCEAMLEGNLEETDDDYTKRCQCWNKIPREDKIEQMECRWNEDDSMNMLESFLNKCQRDINENGSLTELKSALDEIDSQVPSVTIFLLHNLFPPPKKKNGFSNFQACTLTMSGEFFRNFRNADYLVDLFQKLIPKVLIKKACLLSK